LNFGAIRSFNFGKPTWDNRENYSRLFHINGNR
jgi:hypothetical protein